MNPLDQLADITIPNEVSVWPLAWGMWLLIGLLCIAIIWASLWIIKRRKFNRAKRQALDTLLNLDKQSPYYAHKVQVLLKQLCSVYVPTQASAHLHGEQWKNLIMSVYCGQKQNELETALDSIFKGMYERETANTEQDHEQINAAITNWIKTSLPLSQSRLLQVANTTKNSVQNCADNRTDNVASTASSELTNV